MVAAAGVTVYEPADVMDVLVRPVPAVTLTPVSRLLRPYEPTLTLPAVELARPLADSEKLTEPPTGSVNV